MSTETRANGLALPRDIADRPASATIGTPCGKTIAIVPNQWGTAYITITDPETLTRPGYAMWTNLSPRDVAEIVDGLLAAVPAAGKLLASDGPS